jgi:co-chaperonin GroES (HSP10)
MKVKAVGRHLLIRVETDSVQETTVGGIALPPEYLEKLKGGVQTSTVLSVGDTAFDDQMVVRDIVTPGCKVITSKYPGQGLDVDPNWSDDQAAKYRVVMDNEIRAVISDEGVDLV